MFGSLGSISFEVINSPQRMRASYKYVFKELAVIRGKPVLQYIYTDLERISLEFMFHQEFTDPQVAEDALRAIADAHQIVPFVLGNGDHQGEFIITAIKRSDIWRADDGTAVAIQVHVDLLEWSANLPAGAPSDIPTSTPGLLANGQPQTALYSGSNQVPPAPIPPSPAGMEGTEIDNESPMFPTYPLLPFIPLVGQWSQIGGFASVSLQSATRWGF